MVGTVSGGHQSLLYELPGGGNSGGYFLHTMSTSMLGLEDGFAIPLSLTIRQRGFHPFVGLGIWVS